MKTEDQKCPFCSQVREVSLHDRENRCLFDCPKCGEFLIVKRALDLLNEGEFAVRKARFLDMIKTTPQDHLTFIRHRLLPEKIGENKSDVFAEHAHIKTLDL